MKKIVIFMSLLVSPYILAQVGIQTINPQGGLHIDAKKDTQGSTNIEDDFILDATTGNIGLGVMPSTTEKLKIKGSSEVTGNYTNKGEKIIEQRVEVEKLGVHASTPTHPIHLVTNRENLFRLADTSERTGSLLTTDAAGNVYWEPMKPLGSIVEGRLKANVRIQTGGSGKTDITDQPLVLTPGKWMVFARAVTEGNLGGFSMYIELRKANGESITRRGAYAEKGSPYIAVVPLTFIVDVPTATPTTAYHIHLACTSLNGYTTNTNAFAGKMHFYALRIDRDNTLIP